MSKTVTLGQRLKKLRNELDISKTEMAKLLNISRVAYTNYENDARSPDSILIPEFCKVFGVTADYLLGISETRTPVYAKVAETTGLNEEAILYLKRIRHSSFSGNIDIINLLLNDEPDTSYFDNFPITPPPPMSNEEMERKYNEYIAQSDSKEPRPILEALSEDWSYNDYYTGLSHEEKSALYTEEQHTSVSTLTKEEIEKACAEVKQQQEYFELEWQKSNLLSRIADYLAYREGCSLYSFGQEEPLSNTHTICLGIGNKYMHFPSKESNELFEFMLIQKVIDALKIFKKNFLQERDSKE